MSAGRKLYDEWSTYWPDSTDEPIATYVNDVPKYVISSSLENPASNNTTVLPGDADAVRRLKESIDGDIAMSGSATTLRWLLAQGLLDELRLLVHPIAVGKGQRLFGEVCPDTSRSPTTRWDTPTHKLELVDSATLSSGVLNLTYRPGSEPSGTESGPAEPSGASPT